MDATTASFLESQLEEASCLLADSDLVRIQPIAGPQLVIAEFSCRGLVRDAFGEITEASLFAVGFRFASDYLRRARPAEVLTLISPLDVWHPNMGGSRFPTAICVGPIAAATPLIDLVRRVYEVITWQAFTPLEYDAVNLDACAWARANLHRFPIDARPLRWRSGQGDPTALPGGGSLLDTMEVVP